MWWAGSYSGQWVSKICRLNVILWRFLFLSSLQMKMGVNSKTVVAYFMSGTWCHCFRTQLFNTARIGEILPRTGYESPRREQRYSSTLPLTSVRGGGGWLTPRPGGFTPGKGRLWPLYGRLGGPWGRKNLPLSGIRTLDRPFRKEFLPRLRCPCRSLTRGLFCD